MTRSPEPATPPPLARRLLRTLLGREQREEVIRALDELFREREERDGPRAARAWYRRQVAGFALRWRAFDTRRGGRGTMETWTRDLRLALRALMRAPGFTAVAVLTLALGIGANTAMFSVIEGTLLRPLPYDRPDELVWLADGHRNFGGGGTNQSVPNLMDLRAGSERMRSSAIYRVLGGNLSAGEQALRVPILFTSSELLDVLGMAPALGRDLLPPDDAVGAEPAALLTDAVWRSSFGADPGVVGTTITVDARPARVVGVLTPDFTFPGDPRIVMALQHVGADLTRNQRGYNGIARLTEGADAAALTEELQGIFSGLVETYPDANEGWFTMARPLSDYMLGRNRDSLLLLGGAVLLVLLIACVNVANLLLVRAERRHREMAVRYSLGARRSALASLFLAESMILALAGGALGIAGAYGGVDLLVSLYGDTLARADAISINGTVLLATLAASLLVGVVVGLVPLVRVRGDELQHHLKEGARGSSGRGSRLGRGLVAAELALSVVVVAGAGLMANSMWRLQRVDLGVRDAQRVMTFTLSMPATSYPDAAAIGGFVDELEARLEALPGVRAAGFVNRLPLLGGDNTTVTAWGDPERRKDFTSVRFVTPGYFEAVGVPLVAGRWFDPEEARGSNDAVIINETLARALFPGEDPVGQRIAHTPGGLVVVGVCGDLAGGSPDRPPPGAFYVPLGTMLRLFGDDSRSPGDYWGFGALVRTTGDPRALLPSMREAVRTIDPGLPLDRVRTLHDIAVDRLGARRFALSLFGVFAGLALLLGSVGIYGVMSYSVAQRAREVGMRMALGASRGSVLRMIFGESARLVVPGLVLGLGAALASARLLDNLLFEVSPLDPWTYVAVATVLTLVSVAATWVPAFRATRVDPAASMRRE